MVDEPAAVAAAPVDLTEEPPEPAAKPAAFDWDAELPLDQFPEAMRESLKGKKLRDFATDHAKFRQAASKLGARNKELEAEIAKNAEKKVVEDLSDEELDTLIEERQAAQQVQSPDYQDVLEAYYETDEIPEEFLDAVEKNGVRVSREDAADFLRWRKDSRQQKIDAITAAAEGQAEGQDLWDWMGSEECTISREMIQGFNGQAREGDYSWVSLVVKKFNEFVEGGGKTANRRQQGRFSRSPTRRGRPPQPRAGEGDISAEQFRDQVLAVRGRQTRGEINKAEAMRLERELVARRRSTSGE